jgi:hypothetical protein
MQTTKTTPVQIDVPHQPGTIPSIPEKPFVPEQPVKAPEEPMPQKPVELPNMPSEMPNKY